MTCVSVSKTGRVVCRAEFELPVSAAAAWGQLRDFRRFAAQDFFHAAVRVDAGGVRRGAALEIDHRFGPFAVTRVGRILQWEEGGGRLTPGQRPDRFGYSFSDLSRNGPRAAFPHVYRYSLRASAPDRSVIEITVAGLWTNRGIPRWLVRLWLRWVFSHISHSVRNSLLQLTSGTASRPQFVAAQQT